MGPDWCCPLLPPSSLFCSLELKIRIVVLSRHPGKSKHSWSVHTVSPILFQPPATPNQGFCESVQQSSVTSLSIKPHGTSAHQTSSQWWNPPGRAAPQSSQTQPLEVPHTSIQTPGKPNDISILLATGTCHHPWSWRLRTSCILLGNVQPTAWALPLPQKKQPQKGSSCYSHSSESSELSKADIYSPKLPPPPQFTLGGLWWACITLTPAAQPWAQVSVGWLCRGTSHVSAETPVKQTLLSRALPSLPLPEFYFSPCSFAP